MRSLSCLWGERERVRYVRVPMLIEPVYEVPFVQKTHSREDREPRAQTPEQTDESSPYTQARVRHVCCVFQRNTVRS